MPRAAGRPGPLATLGVMLHLDRQRELELGPPSGRLAATMPPPWPTMIDWQMARPIPMPVSLSYEALEDPVEVFVVVPGRGVANGENDGVVAVGTRRRSIRRAGPPPGQWAWTLLTSRLTITCCNWMRSPITLGSGSPYLAVRVIAAIRYRANEPAATSPDHVQGRGRFAPGSDVYRHPANTLDDVAARASIGRATSASPASTC